MVSLNLPEFEHKIKQIEGKAYIFDVLRKKYVRITPEEWVRQHVVHLLISQYGYPKPLLRAEGGLTLNSLQKRTDVMAFDREGRPFLLVECKAPHIPLTQQVFDQAARYNHVHRAPYLLVTNGMIHYCCRIDPESGTTEFLADFPKFFDA
ncbi:type I restriction enzyme HsdR N-terminal domain-containing protein [Tellurirhabdus rosea]|uniref:type I restriction enzyme HsdR N-terminal domain-containing protein n=1 Tax=Tellurirhabdus rosea TaxID=2674997 RepID=UPI00225B1C1A|nr:type I restriction enzyme HsdR N-terminal domain-containing protein [Tellurirhabdus rosea]